MRLGSLAAIAAAMALLLPGAAWAAVQLRFSERVIGTVGGFSSDVAVAQLGGDRSPDVVAAVERGVVEPGGVQVALNRCRGFRFRPFVQGGQAPYRVGVGDLDGDGRADLATANLLGPRVAVLLRSGAGFGPPRYLDVGVGSGHVVIADFDGDRRNDVAVTLLEAGRVAVILRGRTGFRAPRLFDAGAAPLALAAADMDRDGDVDLLVGDRDSQELRLLANRGRAFLSVRSRGSRRRSADRS